MSQDVVLSEMRGSTALITVNRPKALNALNHEVLVALKTALDNADADPEVRGVIITGAGGRAFVAGADIAEMVNFDGVSSQPFAQAGFDAMRAVELCRKPVIAAVSGFALGGGREVALASIEFALACDFIFATPKSKFGQPEVKLGVTPGFGGTQRLARLVGRNKAKDLIFSGRIIGTEEALRIGLVDRIVDAEELLTTALAYLDDIAGMGPKAVAEAKRVINEGTDLPLEAGLELEKKAFCGLFDSSDQKEGMEAFLAKRTPDFKGK